MTRFNAAGYTVIAPSYRAHGGSSGRERLRWTRLSEYLEDAVLVTSGLSKPPVVIGHSLGGAVAQRFLETQLARAAVLVASVPPNGALGSTLRLARRHPLEFLKIVSTFSLLPIVGSPKLVRAMFYSPTTSEAIILETFQNVQDESFTALLELQAFRSKLPVGKHPMLILGGEQDGIISPDELRSTSSAYGATLKLYPDTGHNLMLEANHDAIATDILEWLGGLG